jgi:predicted nucleic acid-binding protein
MIVSNTSPIINLACIGQLDLLIDERRGRRTVERLGIPIVGLIGVLLIAKRQGLITQLRPHLDSLRNTAGFWISTALYDRVLWDSGETAG